MGRAAAIRATVLLAAAGYLAVYLAVAGPAALAFGLISQFIFILPGVLIIRAIAPAEGWLPAFAFGPFVGQALGSLVLTLFWVAGAREAWLMAAAPAIVAALIVPARQLRGRWTLPATDSSDAAALALLTLVVPLIVGLPFAHVGEVTVDGQAYRAYFTADYVWRRAVVIELAKGASLPVNPYFAGDALHYYWMPHVLTAIQYRFAGAWAPLDQLLLVRSISIDLFFVTFLYGMARLFRIRAWAAACGVAFVIVASSFEGLYALFDFSSKNVPLANVKNLNIDAISRWYFQGIPIDGLQRLLFYQPHHALGYSIGLIGLLAVSARAQARDATVFAIAGLCLGLSIVISSFAGLMVTTAAMLHEFFGVLRARDLRRGFLHAAAAGLPLGAAVAMVFWLRYVDTSGSVIAFGINPVAVRQFWWVTVLSFGPVLVATVIAIPGLLAERRGLSALAALAAASIIFYFFVNVRDHQDVYVGWRVGHFLFMSAAVVVGVLLEQILVSTAAAQPVQWAVLVLALLAGLPTTIIDVYNTQDITNHNQAPGFRWTLVLKPDERQAFDWIQQNTRPEALFQVDPLARDSETWAYLPAFAERRMAIGLPISMVPLAKYQEGSAAIRAMFDEAPLAAYERASRARVNYVLIGPPEREAHPGVEERFNSISSQMPLAFKNATISIYEVRH